MIWQVKFGSKLKNHIEKLKELLYVVILHEIARLCLGLNSSNNLKFLHLKKEILNSFTSYLLINKHMLLDIFYIMVPKWPLDFTKWRHEQRDIDFLGSLKQLVPSYKITMVSIMIVYSLCLFFSLLSQLLLLHCLPIAFGKLNLQRG